MQFREPQGLSRTRLLLVEIFMIYMLSPASPCLCIDFLFFDFCTRSSNHINYNDCNQTLYDGVLYKPLCRGTDGPMATFKVKITLRIQLRKMTALYFMYY